MTGESIYVYCCLRPLPPGSRPPLLPTNHPCPPPQDKTKLVWPRTLRALQTHCGCVIARQKLDMCTKTKIGT